MRNTLEQYRIVPMIVVMGTIFFLSHQTGDSIDLPSFPGMDKLAHFFVYGVLAFTIIGAHRRQSRVTSPVRVIITTLVICLLYGISDEYHQSFIPGRFVSRGDLVADITGACTVCLSWLIFRNSSIRNSK